MKRFFAGLLALLLLIPAVCFSGFSAEADATTATGGGRLPARYGTVEVDGVPEKDLVMNYSLTSDRSGWVTLGAAWNAQSKMLYIGVLAEHAEYYAAGEIGWGKQKSRENAKIDDVTVTVGETVYRFTEGALVTPENEALAGSAAAGRIGEVDGAYLEFAIPLAALSVWKNDDGVVFTDLSVRVDIAENTETFEGAVLFTSQSVTWESTVAGEYGVATEKNFSQKAIGAALVKDYENGMLVEDISLAVIENGVNQFHHIGSKDLFPKDGTTTVEMDFLMPANVPVSAPKTTEASSNGWGNQFLATRGNGMRALIYLGAGGQVIVDGWRASAAFPIVLGIYNTADGLTVYLDNGQSPYGGEGVKLGKQAGEYVRLGFETTPVEGGYRVTVLVDGIAVGNMTATAAHATMPLNRGNVLGLGCASDILENPVEDAGAHIIYSNITVSQKMEIDPANLLLKDYGILQGNCFQKSAVGADGTYAIRFLTTIEDFLCDAYAEVGFEVVAVQADGTESKPIERRTNKVYSTILADNETVSAPNGTYWVAVAVNGIPAEAVVTFVIRPFAVTASGEKHYGAAGQITLPYTSN